MLPLNSIPRNRGTAAFSDEASEILDPIQFEIIFRHADVVARRRSARFPDHQRGLAWTLGVNHDVPRRDDYRVGNLRLRNGYPFHVTGELQQLACTHSQRDGPPNRRVGGGDADDVANKANQYRQPDIENNAGRIFI